MNDFISLFKMAVVKTLSSTFAEKSLKNEPKLVAESFVVLRRDRYSNIIKVLNEN